MPSTAEENQKAKMQFIDAFFDSFDEKTAYLEELYASGRRDEARTLCSCYIDGLASALYWPKEETKFTFVSSLREHSGKEVCSHIHPKMLDVALEKLSKSGKRWMTIYRKIADELQGVDRRLYAEEEIIDRLAPLLRPPEVDDIRRQLWRGTFAAIVYDRFRIPAVHGFGPPDGITFDSTTFRGQPVPAIDFPLVHAFLKRLVSVARELSQSTGQWFGHDFEWNASDCRQGGRGGCY